MIRAAPGAGILADGKPVRRLLYRAGEFADARGKFHKHAKKPAERARQEADVAAGRLWPVTALPMFEEQAADWLLLDFDTVSAPAGVDWRADLAWTAAYLRLQLPAEFHDADACSTPLARRLTRPSPTSAATLIKMRLGFVLDRGVTFAQAKRWLAGTGIDNCTAAACPADLHGRTDLSATGWSTRSPASGWACWTASASWCRSRRWKSSSPRADREQSASYGPVQSAEGLGLLPSPRLDAALERLAGTGGATGTVRWALLQAAFAYAKDVGRDHVDIEALADALAAAGGALP